MLPVSPNTEPRTLVPGQSRSGCNVRAVRCSHAAADDEVYEALKRATMPLEKAWARLKLARRVVVKFNQDCPPSSVACFQGQRLQLVSDAVARATLRLLRERTGAELFCADVGVNALARSLPPMESTTIASLLREFGVRYLDCMQPPHRTVRVPGGGLMFRRYTVLDAVAGADAMVSVAKAKSHVFTGITACLKNLFGLMPTYPAGRPRSYYHHIVRLPYVLADIGRVFDPVLNIADMLVTQAGAEWTRKDTVPRIVDAIVAGDNAVTTDACVMRVMGLDQSSDWGRPPFHRDRNPLLASAESGYGTVDPALVDFQSEVEPQPDGAFFSIQPDSSETVRSWRKTMSEQALFYRDNRQRFEQYTGSYIMLQDGEVIWHGTDPIFEESRRSLAGAKPDSAAWIKFVDPDEKEGEHFEVYERALAGAGN